MSKVLEYDLKRYEQLKTSRAVWEALWQECIDNILPRRGDVAYRNIPGQKRGRLYDTTASNCLELLAAALHGMLTNPATPWFELVTQDPNLMEVWEVVEWLALATKRMRMAYNSSNFGTQSHELYIDLGLIGTGCLYQEEGEDTILRFMTYHISGTFFVENHEGYIDTVYRRDWMSARNIMARWAESASPKVKDAYEKNPDDEFEILHVVRPRSERIPGKIDKLNKPFASVYYEVGEKVQLSEGGYDEFPYAVPRWYLTTGETYGRSPAMTALPDVKLLNEICKTTIRGAQKAIDPPLMVPDDGFMGALNTYPGGLNYYNTQSPDDRVYPLETKSRPELGLQMEEQKRTAIRRTFYVDQFRLPSVSSNGTNPVMTATEIMERTQENLRLMGPILGRQQSEYLTPMLSRSFGIMLRGRYLPPPPAILKGKILTIKYVSPMARAQRSTELQGIASTLDLAAAWLQSHPELVDNFNLDSVIRLAAEINGVPPAVMMSPDLVKKMRVARQEETEKQSQMGEAGQLAEMVGRAAPALKLMKGGMGGGGGQEATG